LVEAARQRLRRWNLTPEQVREIEESGEIQETVTLYYESHDQASEGGVVTERRAVDGQAVAEGDQLFTIADFTHLWMEADVFEYELPWLEEGLHVEIRSASFPGRVFGGTISFIFPSLNPETRTARVRVDIANPDLELRPEMYVDARIHVPIGRVQDVLARMSEDARARVPAAMGRQISDDLYLCPMLCSSGHSDSPGERCPDCGMNLLPRDEVLAQHPELISQASAEAQVSAGERVLSIPDLAVLRTGEREIVFVQTAPGTYERREIVTGPAGQVEVDGVNERWVPVLAGLRLGEEVVTRGNFMLDSQTTLTGGASAAYGSALETGTAQTTSPAAGHRH
ncbi:MAG: efflux RND transporter periplasmic adaptor subunit, partial [Candidatus Sumerlaeia bacterium]|nr:efflux RND transporter periplasmic adaptor subunit [Candidatus Sumerlaeia bacterium]